MSNSTFFNNFKRLFINKLTPVILVGIFLTLLVTSLFLAEEKNDVPAEITNSKPRVTLISANEYGGQETLSLIGTARPFTEANITSERSGRIVSVNVVLGQRVGAGTIIASLENASERASVLQAEGVYDAALASANQSGLAVPEAETTLENAQKNAVSVIRSSYNTTNSAIISNIDKFFSQPNSPLPGLRIGGQGYTSDLNKERVTYQSLLPEWKNRTDSLDIDDDLQAELDFAKRNVQRTIDFIDIFLIIFDERTDDDYNADEINFSNLRADLLNTLSSLNNAQSSIANANDAIVRSTATARGGEASSAEAQVKQALGALRSAQANLEKTILRSPINGTINSLEVKTGDFLNALTPVAVVANNSALEIITYVSEEERLLLGVGDTVLIDNQHEGRVAQISPAVDPETKKIEVRITTDNPDIIAGTTVRINKEIEEKSTPKESVSIPISAVRFEAVDGFVFIIEEGRLVAKSVVLGTARGDSIEIVEGLSNDDLFVRDARGLVVGTEVEINS
jgi:RND family efflux transporter MFP subunit